MIISGGSRSNWRFFARHLTNAKDNDRVRVVELRGLAADNVLDALREMDAVASGTRCTNGFYHADINPREDETLTPEQWEYAVDTLEKNLGLAGHSRLVVEHEKEGRIHRHVIWSRIDPDTMTAVSDSRDYAKHQLTSRTLEREFGHESVRGAHEKDGKEKQTERRPKNWEKFRGNKSGIDPEHVKAEVTALWHEAENGTAFQAALEECGYFLCKGERRDFCIIDPAGDVHSLARRISGAKAADIRAGLADIHRDALPTVEEAREKNTARERADSEGHRRLRRVQLDRAMQPYLQNDRDADEKATGEKEQRAQRAEKARQRRERRDRLLRLEKQMARGSSMASRDALQQAVAGKDGGYTATEARERAAHTPSLVDELQPYVRAAEAGRPLQPPSAFFERAAEFMRRTAREYHEAIKDAAILARDTWTKYLQARTKEKERESQEPGLER